MNEFVECESAPSPMQHPPSPRSQHLRDEDIADLINYGSENDSAESGEEDEDRLPFPPIPRRISSLRETPLDEDDGEDDDFAVGDPALAVNPAPAIDPATASDIPPTATDQPWSLYDFKWTNFPDSPIPPESRRETFSESNVGPTTPRDDPYDIFVDIWDRQIMEHIAFETNKYAQQVAAQMLDNHTLHHSSHIDRWYDTTVDELYVYFGIILAMGIMTMTVIEEYWVYSCDDIFVTPNFKEYMSFDRFMLLNKFLHFNDNDDMSALELDCSEAKLYKIQPIVSHLKKKFQDLYTPAQNIALDESLLKWKSSNPGRQIKPSKPPHRGINTYEICESQTGYLWRFEVHPHGKIPKQRMEDPLEACTPSTVLRLIKGLENKGYTLWMDDFYNSPYLARRLKCLGFDCAGTLRTDRKFVPQVLHNITDYDMYRGQVAGLTSGDVDVLAWRYDEKVAMISTYHGNGQQIVEGFTCPTLILDYNNMMLRVDKKDLFHLKMYLIDRRQTKVWYKKFFRRLFNASVLNSFIIHNHSSPLAFDTFRANLTRSLLSRHASPFLLSLASIMDEPMDDDQPVDDDQPLAEF